MACPIVEFVGPLMKIVFVQYRHTEATAEPGTFESGATPVRLAC